MAVKIKNQLNIWEYKDYCRWYRIDKKLSIFFRKVKWMLQRAKCGYCDMDLWNLDYTLGNYIASSVNELANRTHGYPPRITYEQWIDILHSISTNFYLGVNDDAWFNPYEDKVSYDAIYSELSEKEKAVWDKWLEAETENDRAMHIRRQEGIKLLGEWFPHLWD